jgi:glycosyltransferase involved in cell wall biosynthesis
MNRKLNVGILSDSPFITTGYRNQSVLLGNMLVDEGHNVYYFAHAYSGQPVMPGVIFEDGRKLNFTIIGQGREPYFKDLLEQYVKVYKIDVLIILLDTFMLYPWLLQMDLSPAKTIFWFPSDGGGGMPLGCENILKKVNVPIAMAKFGQKQVKKCHGIDTKYIPHSINPKQFYPLPKEEILQLKAQWGLQDKFVIGVVARNQGRKMLDRTIKIMAMYAKINPNAVLLLHLDPEDPAQPFPLGVLIQRYGIQNRVVFTGMKWSKGFNDADMNKIYNVMDCFLLSTSGEGFGIPLIEAMACEIPVLATDYTTTRELVIDNNAGLGIKLAGVEDEENPNVHCDELLDGTLTGSWVVERGMCSIKDGANKLDYLFKNPDKRKEFGKNGRVAVLRDYIEEVTKKEWLKIIEELGGSY